MKKKGTKESGRGNWREIWHFLTKIHLPFLWILIAFLCNFFYQKVMLILPSVTAGLLSGSLEKEVLMDAIWFYVLFTIVLCADIAFRTPAQHIAARNTRRAIWKRMLHIRMDYYDQHNPSDLMSTITNDTTTAMQLLVGWMTGFLPAVYYTVSALETISTYNIWLMVSVFLLLPIKIIYMIVVGRMNYKTQAGVYRRIGGLTAYLAERVRGLSLIKTYTNEKKELENGEKAAHELFHANMRVTKLQCVITGIDTLIGLAQVMIVMVFGVILLQRGDITIQQWIAFYMFSGTISNNFSTLIGYWTQLKTIQGTLSRAAHLFMAPGEEKKDSGEKKQPENMDIVFEDVSFSYGEKKALDHVSFRVPEGTSTAIIGLCGSGKTTSISLMERFYVPESGRVLLGGVSVSDLTLDDLRSHFGYVQQKAEIFSGTIREIVTYGLHREVTDQEIWDAAEKIGVAELIRSRAEGLDTPVTAGGASLSGGQRQKLVLTREFLRKAEILLLDEPTSALDAAASRTVQEAVFSLFPGRSKIIVTHDLSLLEQVDQIVVLENGVLKGCGTYQDLQENCETFRELLMAGCEKKEAAQ